VSGVGLTRIGGSGPGVCAEHIALRVGGRVLGSRLPVTQDTSVAVGQGHSRVQRRCGGGSNRRDCAWLICASVAKRACCRHSGCTAQRCASELYWNTPVSERAWRTLHPQVMLLGSVTAGFTGMLKVVYNGMTAPGLFAPVLPSAPAVATPAETRSAAPPSCVGKLRSVKGSGAHYMRRRRFFGQRHCSAGRYNGARFKWYHYTGLDDPIVAEDSCSCTSRWTCKRCSAKLHRRCQTHIQVLSVLGCPALGMITAGFQDAVVLIPVDVTAPGFFRRHLPSTPAVGALAARPAEGCAPKLHNTLCLKKRICAFQAQTASLSGHTGRSWAG